MFGKRKEDRRHRYAEEGSDDLLDADASADSELDPELAAALLELGLNRDAPLREPESGHASDVTQPSEPDAPSEPDESAEPDRPGAELSEPADSRDSRDSAEPVAPSLPSWAGVQTAAMLAEPEDVDRQRTPAGEVPTQAALQRERAKAAEQESALQRAQDRVASQKAELKQARSSSSEPAAADVQAMTARVKELEQSLRESQGRVDRLTADLERARSKSPAPASDEVRAAVDRAEAAEKSARELESSVSALKAELERARSEATAAGVALERMEREAKDQGGAAMIPGPQADAAQADSLRLAADLAANLQRQEAMIAALAGLQAEVTEQRAWFEAQIANQGQTESQQASVIETLQAAVRERDIELEALRQHLLEAETKRAEEAAAFVAALERQ